ATSDDRMMAVEGRRKPLLDPLKFTGKRKEYAGWSQQMQNKIRLDKRFIGGDEDIWYYINACLDHRPQQVMATFYTAGGVTSRLERLPQQASEHTLSRPRALQASQRDAEGDMVMSGISRTKGKEKARSHLPQPIKDNCKCFNCNQIGHIAKVKKAARPKESSSSTTEELGSSETEESSGKE
ncbi:hypothetical protein K456DRAFT_59055, partial [Colletotrichum gloeosporioides 23]